MRPKTEELLYYLLYYAEMVSRPTWRNLDRSFESWAYQNGFHRQLRVLEASRLIERQRGPAVKRIYRLTEKGRLHSLGGRDPEALWHSDWDGVWRMVLFDIPRADNAARDRLRKLLHDEWFGCLQHSVWISPRPLSGNVLRLCNGGDDPGAIVTMTGRPGAGEKDLDIVKKAWDFDRINEQYAVHTRIVAQRPSTPIRGKQAADTFHRWATRERAAWLEAFRMDPLLPLTVAPPEYVGQRAWKRRRQALSLAAAQISSAKL